MKMIRSNVISDLCSLLTESSSARLVPRAKPEHYDPRNGCLEWVAGILVTEADSGTSLGAAVGNQ